MINICGTCTPSLTKRYDSAVCPTTRRAGWPYLVLFDCKLRFDTDILDTAEAGEWATHITGDLIRMSPQAGNVNFTGKTTEDLGVDGNGVQRAGGVTTYSFEFTSTSALKTREDEDWWRNFYEDMKSQKWNVGFLDTENGLGLPDAHIDPIKAGISGATAVPIATQVGYSMSVTDVPDFKPLSNSGDVGVWTFTGFVKSNHVMRHVEIPGLVDVLSANA